MRLASVLTPQGEPGYTMLGRLFAYGYMRGLMQSVEKFVRVPSQS